MTQQALRQIFVMALDIKVPEHGPMQILEFMSGHMAGYKGYKQLDGKDMTTDVILPYLRKIFSSEIVDQIGKPVGVVQLGHAYGDKIAEKGSGILYPVRAVRRGNWELSRLDLQIFRHYPEITVANTDQQFLLTAGNKAAQAYLVKEDKTLGRYYTPSFVTTTRYNAAKADRIHDYFNHDGDYIIKPVDQSQGNGVRIVAADDLDQWMKKTLIEKRKGRDSLTGTDFWKTDINPVMLVQPYIASRPVSYKGEDYDGTLRVFVTAHRDGPGQPWIAKAHEGYWKLPPTSIENRGVLEKARISHSPDRQEANSAFMSVATFAAHKLSFGLIPCFNASVLRKRMNSVAMTDALRAEIFPQVETFCSRMPAVLEQKSLYQRTWDHLSSDSRPRQGTGVLMATDPMYYPGREHDPLPLSAKVYPDCYIERMKELCLKDHFNAVRGYIDGLRKDGGAHNKGFRPYAPPLDTLLKDPGFIARMEGKDLAGKIVELIHITASMKL